VQLISLHHDQIQAALSHIQTAIDAGREGNDREGLANRTLTKILIDLDLGIKVVPE
jgi:hypothetical protein